MITAFNKRLTLLNLEYPAGRGEPKIASQATVWANVSEPGTVTKMQAHAVGVDVSYVAVMWRNEFKGFTHAEYGGVRYKIASTGAAENSLHIKLTLERNRLA